MAKLKSHIQSKLWAFPPPFRRGACFSLQSFLFAEMANKKVFPLQSLTQLDAKTKVDFNSTLSNCGNY